jgi:hypothetical protein
MFHEGKKPLVGAVLAALLGATTLIASASPASAYVVCNHWGRCWHVHPHYYHPAYYGYYGDPYYDDDDYYGGYYGGGPYAYGPGLSLGFNFGGGHDHGWHGGGGHHH